MKVVKFSGAVVDFEPEKLKKSLLKSGATPLVVDRILVTIQSQIYNGITKLTFHSDSSAVRSYNIK